MPKFETSQDESIKDQDNKASPKRSKPQRPWKSKTIPLRKLAANLRVLPVEYPDIERPKTRADCRYGPRPCPFVTCRHHLFLEVKENHAIQLTFGDHDVDEIPETCSLDVAERGAHTLHEVGEILGITRERLRQIEETGMRKLQTNKVVLEIVR